MFDDHSPLVKKKWVPDRLEIVKKKTITFVHQFHSKTAEQVALWRKYIIVLNIWIDCYNATFILVSLKPTKVFNSSLLEALKHLYSYRLIVKLKNLTILTEYMFHTLFEVSYIQLKWNKNSRVVAIELILLQVWVVDWPCLKANLWNIMDFPWFHY